MKGVGLDVLVRECPGVMDRVVAKLSPVDMMMLQGTSRAFRRFVRTREWYWYDLCCAFRVEYVQFVRPGLGCMDAFLELPRSILLDQTLIYILYWGQTGGRDSVLHLLACGARPIVWRSRPNTPWIESETPDSMSEPDSDSEMLHFENFENFEKCSDGSCTQENFSGNDHYDLGAALEHGDADVFDTDFAKRVNDDVDDSQTALETILSAHRFLSPSQADDGGTALHYAVQRGWTEGVVLLLERGAEWKCVSRAKTFCSDWASEDLEDLVSVLDTGGSVPVKAIRNIPARVKAIKEKNAVLFRGMPENKVNKFIGMIEQGEFAKAYAYCIEQQIPCTMPHSSTQRLALTACVLASKHGGKIKSKGTVQEEKKENEKNEKEMIAVKPTGKKESKEYDDSDEFQVTEFHKPEKQNSVAKTSTEFAVFLLSKRGIDPNARPLSLVRVDVEKSGKIGKKGLMSTVLLPGMEVDVYGATPMDAAIRLDDVEMVTLLHAYGAKLELRTLSFIVRHRNRHLLEAWCAQFGQLDATIWLESIEIALALELSVGGKTADGSKSKYNHNSESESAKKTQGASDGDGMSVLEWMVAYAGAALFFHCVTVFVQKGSRAYVQKLWDVACQLALTKRMTKETKTKTHGTELLMLDNAHDLAVWIDGLVKITAQCGYEDKEMAKTLFGFGVEIASIECQLTLNKFAKSSATAAPSLCVRGNVLDKQYAAARSALCYAFCVVATFGTRKQRDPDSVIRTDTNAVVLLEPDAPYTPGEISHMDSHTPGANANANANANFSPESEPHLLNEMVICLESLYETLFHLVAMCGGDHAKYMSGPVVKKNASVSSGKLSQATAKMEGKYVTVGDEFKLVQVKKLIELHFDVLEREEKHIVLVDPSFGLLLQSLRMMCPVWVVERILKHLAKVDVTKSYQSTLCLARSVRLLPLVLKCSIWTSVQARRAHKRAHDDLKSKGKLANADSKQKKKNTTSSNAKVPKLDKNEMGGKSSAAKYTMLDGANIWDQLTKVLMNDMGRIFDAFPVDDPHWWPSPPWSPEIRTVPRLWCHATLKVLLLGQNARSRRSQLCCVDGDAGFGELEKLENHLAQETQDEAVSPKRKLDAFASGEKVSRRDGVCILLHWIPKIVYVQFVVLDDISIASNLEGYLQNAHLTVIAGSDQLHTWVGGFQKAVYRLGGDPVWESKKSHFKAKGAKATQPGDPMFPLMVLDTDQQVVEGGNGYIGMRMDWSSQSALDVAMEKIGKIALETNNQKERLESLLSPRSKKKSFWKKYFG